MLPASLLCLVLLATSLVSTEGGSLSSRQRLDNLQNELSFLKQDIASYQRDIKSQINGLDADLSSLSNLRASINNRPPPQPLQVLPDDVLTAMKSRIQRIALTKVADLTRSLPCAAVARCPGVDSARVVTQAPPVQVPAMSVIDGEVAQVINLPASQTTGAPAAQNVVVPTAQNAIAPVAPDAPVAQNTGAPVAKNTNASVAQNSNASVAQNTEEPVAQNTNAPVAQSTEAPVAQNTNAPVSQNTEAPVAQNTNAPVAQNTNAPVSQNAPTTKDADAPTAQDANKQLVKETPVAQTTKSPILTKAKPSAAPVYWPSGPFLLLKPLSGCPVTPRSSWREGYIGFNTESTDENHDKVSENNHLSPPVSVTDSSDYHLLYMHFCKHTGRTGRKPWPQGSYCIGSAQERCPPGFKAGSLEIDQEDTDHRGEIKGMDNDVLYFCCRKDGNANTPISLPNTSPFYLYRFGGQCQEIKGMNVAEESMTFDTENDENEDSYDNKYHPDGQLDDVRIELCYYS